MVNSNLLFMEKQHHQERNLTQDKQALKLDPAFLLQLIQDLRTLKQTVQAASQATQKARIEYQLFRASKKTHSNATVSINGDAATQTIQSTKTTLAKKTIENSKEIVQEKTKLEFVKKLGNSIKNQIKSVFRSSNFPSQSSLSQKSLKQASQRKKQATNYQINFPNYRENTDFDKKMEVEHQDQIEPLINKQDLYQQKKNK